MIEKLLKVFDFRLYAEFDSQKDFKENNSESFKLRCRYFKVYMANYHFENKIFFLNVKTFLDIFKK